MSRRSEVPTKLAAELLAANNRTCCVCEEPRKHVQIHHIDSNSSNNDWENLAVVCLDCHSRITGTEGLGRRYSVDEVRLYKTRWEQACADDDQEEEPLTSEDREFVVRPEEHQPSFVDLEEGQLLLVSVESDEPIDVLVASRRKYDRWEDDEEITPDVLIEDHFRTDVEFVAPRDGAFVLWVYNADAEAVATVSLDVAIWPAEDD